MIKFKSKNKLGWLQDVLLIAFCASGLSILINYLGIFQFLEWSAFDFWFRLRPAEKQDRRIVVVTIDESDLQELGEWPISDETLSELITKLNQQQPKAIGLDLYRDLAVKPGTERLNAVLRSSPNVIGIEKAVDQKVAPQPILKVREQVAFADLVIDGDGKVRRSLLSIKLEHGGIQLGLAARLALMYLAEEGIELKAVGDTHKRSLGKAIIAPFQSHDGGYIRADAGGFQTLLNYRGTETSFYQASIVDILNGDIPPDFAKNRVVLIGSTAPSLNDLFFTPYSSDRTGKTYLPGVFIHANAVSQILSGALDGRKLIKVVSEPYEWLWVFTWTVAGSIFTLILLSRDLLPKPTLSLIQWTIIYLIPPGAILFGGSYLLFLQGWWLPVVPSLFSSIISTLTVSSYYNQHQRKIAYIDDLTQIPNRRFLNKFLEYQWYKSRNKQRDLCLILCDVDYFKNYNDTYGHQAGDICLQQVAQVLSNALRPFDIVARYGGEEFLVVLINANAEVGMMVAKRIREHLKSRQIPHSSSQASEYISLSCGVASTSSHFVATPEILIEIADRALYQAKAQGRDRAVLAN